MWVMKKITVYLLYLLYVYMGVPTCTYVGTSKATIKIGESRVEIYVRLRHVVESKRYESERWFNRRWYTCNLQITR